MINNNQVLHFKFDTAQHLANAGLINGIYTGKSGSGYGDHAILSENVPKSKISNSGWSIVDDILQDHPAHPNNITYGYSHSYPFIFGGQTASHETNAPILTPEEAWNIDVKIDDGIAVTGNIVSHMDVTDCITSAAPYNYKLNHSGIACPLIFRK